MKYVFKPYNPIFPTLFEKEKSRIAAHLGRAVAIEHIGSTAVPGLGGKGIIDIAIAVDRNEIENVSKKIQEIGYEFRPNFSTPDRFYFVAIRPDPEEGERRYHIHLTYPENSEWKDLIFVRDYLRAHPEEAREYEELKKKAASEANQEGEKYRAIKNPLIRKILQKHQDEPL